MPVRKITEQQFRTRRKDRKMVYVDAAALLVGLLVLAVSVGGVIVIEPEPEPLTWEYSFPEGKVAQKWCAGTIGAREGCQSIDRKPTPEGEPQALLMDPVDAPNVTEAVFRLTWTDEEPDTTKGEHQGKTYRYDANSTDTLRLEVTAPWGDSWSTQGTNNVELRSGEVEVRVNISEAPEPGTMKALEKATVQQALAEQYTDTDHDALGEWQVTVTVVHAGNQNGTLADDVCAEHLPPGTASGLPDDLYAHCYTDEHQDDLERRGASAAPGYTSTYVDPGNMWVLEFFVRTYSASVTY